MSKPRSDSKLKNLPEERQEQIAEWCRKGLEHAREQLAADGLRVSVRALSEFVSWWGLQQRFRAASSRARQIEEMLAEKAPEMDADQVRKLGQAMFTLEAVDAVDAKGFVRLESLRLDQETAAAKLELERAKLKQRDRRLDQAGVALKLAERRVKVAERKLEQLKGALTDGDIDDQQRVRRMKEVFGL